MSANAYSSMDACKPRISAGYKAMQQNLGFSLRSIGGFWTEAGLLNQEGCLQSSLQAY